MKRITGVKLGILLLGASAPVLLGAAASTRGSTLEPPAVAFLAPGNYLLRLSAVSGTTTQTFSASVAVARTGDTVFVRQGTTPILNGLASATSSEVYGSSGSSTITLALTADRNGGGVGPFTASDAHGHTVRGRAVLDPALLIGAPLRERSSCGTFWNCMKVTFRIE